MLLLNFQKLHFWCEFQFFSVSKHLSDFVFSVNFEFLLCHSVYPNFFPFVLLKSNSAFWKPQENTFSAREFDYFLDKNFKLVLINIF